MKCPNGWLHKWKHYTFTKVCSKCGEHRPCIHSEDRCVTFPVMDRGRVSEGHTPIKSPESMVDPAPPGQYGTKS